MQQFWSSGVTRPDGIAKIDFAQKLEAMANQSRATAFDQGMPTNPHPDSYPPVPVSQSGDSIQIIELPRNAIPRIPRKQWRELIQKVWEVDPFICPNCARTMHINGLLEDRNAASALLQNLGWVAYTSGLPHLKMRLSGILPRPQGHAEAKAKCATSQENQ
jgi:hypothetical protein